MQDIHPDAWVAPGVELYGKVHIMEHASLWPRCVVRAEAHEVRIGRYSNIQDFVMLHVGYEHPVHVGDFCSITHHATLHGAVVEDDCLVGIGAVVMDGAVIGRGSIVAPGAVVTEGSVFAPHSIIAGVPAKKVRERDASRENRRNAWIYQRNACAYQRGEHRAFDGPEFAAFLEEIARR